jgi:biopolymer transport protein ExbD
MSIANRFKSKIRHVNNHILINIQDRKYQKLKGQVKRFIQKNKKLDHSMILNNMNIDYDTLMRIIAELKSDGDLI